MNKQVALKKIRTDFPDLKWKKVKHITEGMDHYVLQLDDKYIFRFPRGKKYADRLYAETYFLEYLSGLELGVSVPKYEFIAKDKSFAGYRKLQGVQMTKEIFDLIPKQKKLVIAKQLSSFLSSLHKVPLVQAKKYKIGVYKTQIHYRELRSDITRYLKPRLLKTENDLVENFMKEFRKYLNYPHSTVIHLDLWPNHLILGKGNKLNGIIDFSDRSIGDPAFDFAELWIYGKEFVETVYKSYSGPKDKDLLHRAFLLFKRVPLKMMMFPLKGQGGSFKKSHQYFREIFVKFLI